MSSPGCVSTWVYLYLGVPLPGCISTWVCLHLGVSSPGCISTWVYLHFSVSPLGWVSTWVYLHVGLSPPGCISTWMCLHMGYLHLSVSPPGCLPLGVHLDVSPPGCISAWVCLHLSVSSPGCLPLGVHLGVSPPGCLPAWICLHLGVSLSGCVSIRLCLCLGVSTSACLSVWVCSPAWCVLLSWRMNALHLPCRCEGFSGCGHRCGPPATLATLVQLPCFGCSSGVCLRLGVSESACPSIQVSPPAWRVILNWKQIVLTSSYRREGFSGYSHRCRLPATLSARLGWFSWRGRQRERERCRLIAICVTCFAGFLCDGEGADVDVDADFQQQFSSAFVVFSECEIQMCRNSFNTTVVEAMERQRK